MLFLLPLVALAASHHPVILVPGLAGSQVRAQLKDSSPPHSLCEKSTPPGKWLQLWLSVEEVAPYAKDCLLSRIALTFDNATGAYSDAPGVTLDTNVDFGNVSGVAALDPVFPKESGYFLPLITFLEQLGYVAGADLHGAPYDWRLAPDGHSAPGQYYTKVQALVERTFARNGNRSVHFVTHSLGGPTVLGFLNTMPQVWKDTYIASFAPISGPFGGSVAQANAFVAGDTLGVPLIPHDYLRPIQITAASGSFMMATTEAFGSERVRMMIAHPE
jgi:lysophospholipase-3